MKGRREGREERRVNGDSLATSCIDSNGRLGRGRVEVEERNAILEAGGQGVQSSGGRE